jgi:hypothetical protein
MCDKLVDENYGGERGITKVNLAHTICPSGQLLVWTSNLIISIATFTDMDYCYSFMYDQVKENTWRANYPVFFGYKGGVMWQGGKRGNIYMHGLAWDVYEFYIKCRKVDN